jgi:hypothetical protein
MSESTAGSDDEVAIQSDLFSDYQTNVASYPFWRGDCRRGKVSSSSCIVTARTISNGNA